MKPTSPTQQARQTSLDDLRDCATIPVWHGEDPNAAGVLGISRDLAYKMAASGDLPTIRLSRRLVVPVPRLLAMLGASSITAHPSAQDTTQAHEIGLEKPESLFPLLPLLPSFPKE